MVVYNNNNFEAKKRAQFFYLNPGLRLCWSAFGRITNILAATVGGYNIILLLSSRRALRQTRARNTLYKHNNTLHIQYSGNVAIFLFTQHYNNII